MREANRTKESERKILNEIKSNLQLDLIDLQANIDAHENALLQIDSIQNWESNYKDQIGGMFFDIFRDYLFRPQTSAFETLKSKGVDLITNDSIRINTQRLYDFYYSILIQYESDYIANQLFDDYEWLAIKYYKSFPVRKGVYPTPKIRSAAWLKDDELVVRLDIAKYEHQFALKFCYQVKEEINRLSELIDQELQ